MFAVLHASAETPIDRLIEAAQSFTPRFQVLGPFVLLDVGGLSSLFGTPGELGAMLRAAIPGCRAIVLAPTASAAMLIASGREGLVVLNDAAARSALAELSIDVLIEVTQARLLVPAAVAAASLAPPDAPGAPALSPSIGWRHPRDTHQAHHTRRPRPRSLVSSDARQFVMALQQAASTLRRWGIVRLGALAALPQADVHARLGDLGVSWQRLAAGEDDEPLVPWLAEPVFEALVELEWPIEGFEPLSFVLARLLEPLSARLEQADRGAVAIRTALHLTDTQVHVRVIPLPAPMRDPKTLRTLVLLDLESHPPAAPIDRVQVRLEPTPGRVLQWTLFDRAQPAPEQVATLIARLTALVGDGHVGSPVVVDAWRPGAFQLEPFAPPPPGDPPRDPAPPGSLPLAFRRFRLPIPVRVRVEDGRPVRVTTDRQGVTGGPIAQSAGPWRTSGEWWSTAAGRESGSGSRESGSGSRESEKRLSDGGRDSQQTREGDVRDGDGSVSTELPDSRNDSRWPTPGSRQGARDSRSRSQPWDRDEWDIAMADGTVYRLFVEREVGQWFLEGIFD